MKSIIDQLKEAQKKAKLGMPEERKSAARELKRILKRYGLSMIDVANSERMLATFSYRNRAEKELLIQIIGITIGANGVNFKDDKEDRKIHVYLTLIQGINVSEKYKYLRGEMRKAIKKQVEAVKTAFFLKHGLIMFEQTDNLDINFLEKLEEKNG